MPIAKPGCQSGDDLDKSPFGQWLGQVADELAFKCVNLGLSRVVIEIGMHLLKSANHGVEVFDHLCRSELSLRHRLTLRPRGGWSRLGYCSQQGMTADISRNARTNQVPHGVQRGVQPGVQQGVQQEVRQEECPYA